MKIKKNEALSRYITIGVILASILSILTLVLITVFGSKDGKQHKTLANEEVTPVQTEGSTLDETYTTAVFMEADTALKQITVYDVLTGERLAFDYSTATQITDKYDQLITVSQLTKGQIVKLKYIANVRKLISLSISQDIWEHIGITDLAVNEDAKIISYLGNNYSYSDATIVLSNGKRIEMKDLMFIDYVTVRGWEENIYSIVVTGGHGYLELTGQDQFLGGTLYVGTQSVHQITEKLNVPVREGKVEVTVTNKQTEGTKEVQIERDKTTYCDVGEFNLAPVKEGTILFQITPAGATLWIDNEETPYGSGVTLPVGQHQMEVSLGGYTTYSGVLNVTESTNVVTIALQEKQSGTGEDKVTVAPEPTEPPDDQEEWNSHYNNDDNTSEDDSEEVSEDDSEEDDVPSGVDENSKITIKWKSGADVFFNSEYVGTIENGELTVEKWYGNLSVDLFLDGDTVTHNITVENDGKDVVIRFPDS